MTAIAIPIFVSPGVDLEALIPEAEEALEGADGIIELRCDSATPRQLADAMDLARIPVIVTVRPTWEGGKSTKTDAQRIDLWEAAMENGAEYIDVELVSFEKSKAIREAIEDTAEKSGTRLIVSNHSFDGRPADLEQRIARLRAIGLAQVLKIAWKAGSILDAIEALTLSAQLKKEDGRPAVALAMGEEGLLSRLLAKKFGAPFTFATAARGKESAPGQPTAAELRELYRWETHKASTPVYGVVGWPVGHSLSPHIHNAGFDRAGMEGVYVPLPVKPGYDAFAEAVDALRMKADIRGLSVTIPHKENAFRYVNERGGTMDPLSAKLGVLNTLVWRDRAGIPANAAPLNGLNSDYAGALDALVSAWTGKRADVAGKRVAVLGAGGAARAIVAALAAHGATVSVYNRTREKADALVAEFNTSGSSTVIAADWQQMADDRSEAVINCTPVGMHPHVNAAPVDPVPAHWGPGTVVFDTVYNPQKTRLLKLAEQQGATIIPGTEMFVRQAAIQFRQFTSKEADVAGFRATLASCLK